MRRRKVRSGDVVGDVRNGGRHRPYTRLSKSRCLMNEPRDGHVVDDVRNGGRHRPYTRLSKSRCWMNEPGVGHVVDDVRNGGRHRPYTRLSKSRCLMNDQRPEQLTRTLYTHLVRPTTNYLFYLNFVLSTHEFRLGQTDSEKEVCR